jgi:hypothetical protein
MPHRTGQGKNRQWQIYSNMFKHLPLNVTDCYSKSDFGQLLSYVQFGWGTV